MKPDSKKLAQEWFNSAESDLAYGEAGLKQQIIFPQVAFLSQQSAEKMLKGFLLLHEINPPRIHDLPKLLDEAVKISPELEKLRDSCELLSGFYVESRYPPDIPEFTREDLFDAYTHAKQVYDQIASLIHN